ncbi:Golgi-associated plant pathogenesis-related protein 1-like isoform X3 [Myxocyprinus asiaticus]|uniref:Golgi-associated plant pathogenesis-related protein 1-like isoform X3 n=1 Tax=Myxocyprinus asiaticus TaxID=70543 RepID=UPI0022238471|nr:Golgi-associated plant pathogenesis-related protein 1-like isoform X3 [Myxocyprinus asiaticus]
MGKSASRLFCEEVLKTHNEYRRKHEAPPLKLSNKLSHEAARYAESLASTRILKHSAESSRGNCGENLAWASYDQTGKDVSDRWYNEVNQYNFNQPGFSSATDLKTIFCPRLCNIVFWISKGSFKIFIFIFLIWNDLSFEI